MTAKCNKVEGSLKFLNIWFPATSSQQMHESGIVELNYVMKAVNGLRSLFLIHFWK